MKKANKNKQKVQLDKEILKILRSAVRDLKDTRKALYLNIINSFIQNDFELTEEIFEVFQILDDKVSRDYNITISYRKDYR